MLAAARIPSLSHLPPLLDPPPSPSPPDPPPPPPPLEEPPLCRSSSPASAKAPVARQPLASPTCTRRRAVGFLLPSPPPLVPDRCDAWRRSRRAALPHPDRRRRSSPSPAPPLGPSDPRQSSSPLTRPLKIQQSCGEVLNMLCPFDVCVQIVC
ncbi:hypothetical protein BRADI_2g27145v3 [Brachypodium distachyon]|uniref:Uncharacterized protein n=1 Tax=Brachypodium distachyon TaxID=15368 RepID=A0A2K2DAW5_BRADI|nr:hypothetical protein BRADI_2g27145v3 [Brachypodium distachyon]